jgi:hypothetical protein
MISPYLVYYPKKITSDNQAEASCGTTPPLVVTVKYEASDVPNF